MSDAAADGGREAAAGVREEVTPTPEAPERDERERQTILGEAYDDVREVLSADDECSRFFGGSDVALHVLDQLAGQLRGEALSDSSIGIMMAGEYKTLFNLDTGASFRLFEKAVVNLRGPFFSVPRAGKLTPFVGGLPLTWRGMRAAMLLHELGHLIKGADKKWLLPNDGGSPARSAYNSYTVEKKCGKRLTALRGRPAVKDRRLAANKNR